MKSQLIVKIALFSIYLLSFSSCFKATGDEEVPYLQGVEASTITENSFTASWFVNKDELQSMSVVLSMDENFNAILKTVPVENLQISQQLVDRLSGLTTYFFRVEAKWADGTHITSDVIKVTTGYTTETVNFATSDGYDIAAKIKYIQDNTKNAKKNPGLIFMHELGVFVNNWNNAELITQLMLEGYVCMILDFRGHGQSADYELEKIVEDFGVIAPDLIAAMDFMKNHEAVDSTKLGLLGGSLGAIMAIAGNGFDEVKCTVSLSGARNGMNSIFPVFDIESAFFVSGELDNPGNVDFAEEASKLYDMAVEPKKLKIIPGNSAHGTNLLEANGLNQEIIDWINLCFTNK